MDQIFALLGVENLKSFQLHGDFASWRPEWELCRQTPITATRSALAIRPPVWL